ncbi:methyltransferase-like protein 27 [Megalops cyprinoides]|uniref:methyltransferase-like protein 27 n=1 Tax=Megalops cyprinoides TaxID=118141 RepID=UPI001863E366|nr:methyltransferase-like protein 27 [Megalops cyprinoides]XP_036381095.1 methyltransferase-like protein 27 [Megalops cyprinoides]
MGDTTRTFSDVKNVILSAHKNTGAEDKINFYNNWADIYEQDVALLDYRAPALAAECLSTSFQGNREDALVLDVACGTGLVATWLHKKGFRHFVGVDGSNAMLEVAQSKGLYQELKQSMLGVTALPVQSGTYDVVIIVGALSVGQVPVTIVRELWEAAKPGGYVCMTTRGNADNREFKDELEQTLSEMEQDGLWTRVSVMEVEDWEKAVSECESGYIPGVVYVYRKSAQ